MVASASASASVWTAMDGLGSVKDLETLAGHNNSGRSSWRGAPQKQNEGGGKDLLFGIYVKEYFCY